MWGVVSNAKFKSFVVRVIGVMFYASVIYIVRVTI